MLAAIGRVISDISVVRAIPSDASVAFLPSFDAIPAIITAQGKVAAQMNMSLTSFESGSQ